MIRLIEIALLLLICVPVLKILWDMRKAMDDYYEAVAHDDWLPPEPTLPAGRNLGGNSRQRRLARRMVTRAAKLGNA